MTPLLQDTVPARELRAQLAPHAGMRREMGAQAGMTLIEVMVVMAILAIIGTLVYGGFVQTAQNKQRIESDLDRYHELHQGLDRMARELSMAYVSVQENPNAALRTMDTAFVGSEGAGGSRIDFTSFSHVRLRRDAHESDQNELSYFVTRHPEEPGRKVLARREQRRVDDDPRKGGRIFILVDDVEELRLSYLDPLTHEWVDTWDTTQAAMQPNRLPSQVKILLTVPDFMGKKREVTVGTRAYLPLRYAVNHAVYNAL